MIIDCLSLENFRSAKNIQFLDDLAFDPHINVFYGINGAGKTTILDAITILLSWLIAKIKYEYEQGAYISNDDINLNADSSRIYLRVKHDKCSVSWWTSRNLSKRKGKGSCIQFYSPSFYELCAEIRENHSFPVLIFYPIMRTAFKDFLNKQAKEDSNASDDGSNVSDSKISNILEPLKTYDESLSGNTDFQSFFKWFRAREDIENENIIHLLTETVTQNNSSSSCFDKEELYKIAQDKQLEAVRAAIHRFLPEFSNIRVNRSSNCLVLQKEGFALKFNQLSDGEKCLFALVGDIARRLAIANTGKDGNPLDGKGIVLIDEIDLHLHPEWQRMVIPRLLETFPNCQFFITTHSPLVINHLQPNNLFMLQSLDNELIVQRPRNSYGKDSTRILEDLMGLKTTHTDDVSDALKKIYLQISEDKLTEAREGIAQLLQKGFDDPELKRAETLIRRKELISK